MPPQTADHRARFRELLDKAGIPAAGLKGYKTWAVVLSIVPMLMKEMDINPADGIEPNLTADFQSAHKPIEGLETAAFQFGAFDSLSETAQRKLLMSSIDDIKTAKVDFARILEAWKVGNERAIALNFDKDMKSEPELREVLLHNRNVTWTNWVAARLKSRGTTLMAVGAGHLAGDDSVIAMLRARGFKVLRVG